MKILVNTPDWRRPESGGVANHYHGLRPYWTQDVRYNIVGSRRRPGTGKYWLPWDLLKTALKLLFFRPDIVLLNTSLGPNALKRDAIFLWLSLALGRKVAVHFHGFDVNYAKVLDVNWFRSSFQGASAFLVLSEAIRRQLLEWGFQQRVFLTTTKVDPRLLSAVEAPRRGGNIRQILYLARVEREKGIYLSLDVFALLQQVHPDLCFTVVGGGTELEQAKQYAAQKGIRNICFTGALGGKALAEQFARADLYLFTSFHEGMPTSVLEALCFGLPVVTRPVGGLVDFFEEGRMGAMVDSLDAADFIAPLEALLADPVRVQEISRYNEAYGKSHFLASSVVKHIESILQTVLSEDRADRSRP